MITDAVSVLENVCVSSGSAVLVQQGLALVLVLDSDGVCGGCVQW